MISFSGNRSPFLRTRCFTFVLILIYFPGIGIRLLDKTEYLIYFIQIIRNVSLLIVQLTRQYQALSKESVVQNDPHPFWLHLILNTDFHMPFNRHLL